jgi:hypothetical protein
MIKHFFSYDFWFYVNSVRLETVDQVFAGLSVISLVSAFVFLFFIHSSKHPVQTKLLKKFFALCLTFGLLGSLWYGLRYENIKSLGSHFTFILLLVVCMVWKFYIYKYFFKKYKTEKREYDKHLEKQRYLKK